MKKTVTKIAIGLFIICAIGFNSLSSIGSSPAPPEDVKWWMRAYFNCIPPTPGWCWERCDTCPQAVNPQLCVCDIHAQHECWQCLPPPE